MVAEGQVEACDKCRLALPATGGSDLLHRFSGAKDHPGRYPDQSTPTQRFDHWRREQPGPRPPPQFGCGPLGWVALGMDPAATRGEERGQGVLDAIAENKGHAVRGEAAGHLM